MSDLQCAATLLVLSLDDQEAVDGLAAARVATVYDGQHAEASERAGALAASLGARAASLAEPVTADELRGQRPRAMRVLGEVVDLHRGETVVVLTDTTQPFRMKVDADGVLLEPLR